MRQLPVAVVGMSLGGATTIRLSATRPDLVRHSVIVDVTPAVNGEGRVMTPEQRGSVALVSGPHTYESFQAVFEATMAASPNRTREGVLRGVRHNTVRQSDGRWAWRYDLGPADDKTRTWIDFDSLWDDVAALTMPDHAGARRRLRLRATRGCRRVPSPPSVGASRICAGSRACGAERSARCAGRVVG